MASQRIILSLPPDLLAQLDERRGDTPRAAWVRRAIEQRLAGPISHATGVGANVAVTTVPAGRGQVEPRFKAKR